MPPPISKQIENKLTEIFENFLKKFPLVFEDSVFEAAEIAALYLDKSTRRNLNKRSTGTLANSWDATLIQTLTGLGVAAGAYSDVVYAAIHETGGEITPNAPLKALAIPITQKAFNIGSPRNHSGALHFAPRVGGGVLFDSFDTAQWALRHRVEIPATGYITQAANDAADDIEAVMGDGAYNLIAGRSVFGVR